MRLDYNIGPNQTVKIHAQPDVDTENLKLTVYEGGEAYLLQLVINGIDTLLKDGPIIISEVKIEIPRMNADGFLSITLFNPYEEELNFKASMDGTPIIVKSVEEKEE